MTHLVLGKKVISDIANEGKLPGITTYTNMTNCYDRVAHPFTSLYVQYFGIEFTYLAILFRAIYSMEIFLSIAYRVSKAYYSSGEDRLFEGVVQGSSVALAL